MSDQAPIACTLGAGDLKERLAWIADLNARALTGSHRSDLTLVLEYEPGSIEDVRKLVEGEKACCSFLRFYIALVDDRIRLTIEAPEAAREAAETLFEPFVTRATETPAASSSG